MLINEGEENISRLLGSGNYQSEYRPHLQSSAASNIMSNEEYANCNVNIHQNSRASPQKCEEKILNIAL